MALLGPVGLVGGCGHAPATADHAVRATVVPGAAFRLTDDDLHVQVSADPDVLPAGTLTISRPPSAPPVSNGTAPPVDISTSTAEDLRGLVHVRFDLPANTPATAAVAYWDETGRRWLPTPSRRVGDTLVADTPHLTIYDWFADWLDSPDNPLTTVAGQLMGARAPVPACRHAALPSWVRGSNTENNSASQQLYVCLAGVGDDLEVTAVNNRGVPVTVSLNSPAALASTDLGWPSSLGDLVTKIMAAAPDNGNDLLLPALGNGTLRFHRPGTAGQILGYVHQSVQSILAFVASEAVGQYDASRTIAGWNLSRAGADCVLGLTSTAHDTFTDPEPGAGDVASLVQTFAGCMGDAIDAQIRILQRAPAGSRPPHAIKDLSKVRSGFLLYTLGQEVQKLADAGLDARPAILTSPDISIVVDPGRPAPVRSPAACPTADDVLAVARTDGPIGSATVHGGVDCRDGWATAAVYADPIPPEPPHYVLALRGGSWKLVTTVIDGYPSDLSQCAQLPAWIKQSLFMNCP